MTDFRKWENKPSKEHYHEAMQDPCFYEYFVPGCDGFVTNNISKALHIVNGKKVRYHSLRMDPEWQEWLDKKIREARPGTLITLPQEPVAVNVEIDTDPSMSPEAIQILQDVSIAGDVREGSVVIPITSQYREEWPSDNDKKPKRMPVYGGDGFDESRIQLRKKFALQPALAITVHKAQGDTLKKAIVAMSQSPIHKCNFTYEQVHVAFSRVTESKNLRLLLTGLEPSQKWESITFISNLSQDPTIRWYFMGFRKRLRPGQGNPNLNWTTNEWSACRANQNFLLYLRGFDPFPDEE